MTTHRAGTTGRGEKGFTIIAILVVVAAISAVAVTYSRHVVVYVQSSEVSSSALEAEEIIDSQIAFVLRSQQVGTAISSTTVEDAVDTGAVGSGTRGTRGEAQVTVNALKTAGSAVMDRSSLTAKVVGGNGIGATRLIETSRAPSMAPTDPMSMPMVESSIVAALALDVSVPKISILSSTLIEDTDLYGIIVLSPGVVLSLDNVVIQGAVVSSSSTGLTTLGDYDWTLAPRLDIQGPVRILSEPFLDGLAVHMPDGDLVSSNVDARLQIDGDVLAHTIQLDCAGSITGGIASVDPPALASGMFQVGSGRGPRTWSPVLDHGDIWDPEFVAFVPRKLTVSDLSAISSYEAP